MTGEGGVNAVAGPVGRLGQLDRPVKHLLKRHEHGLELLRQPAHHLTALVHLVLVFVPQREAEGIEQGGAV